MENQDHASSTPDTETLITLTSDIVSAHVSNNTVSVDEVTSLISSVFAALSGLGVSEPEVVRPDPAVAIRSSVKKDHIVCLEDGKKMKMLKRHLATDHGMTPDEYRERWGLAGDYPMVAPAYAEVRRDLAKKIGLGRKPGTKVTKTKAAAPAKATTTKKAAAPKRAADKIAEVKKASAKKAAPKPRAKKAPAEKS